MGLDIGIDLGTATIIVYIAGKGIVLKEPSVIAIDNRRGKILSIGEEAHKMIGKTPDNIKAIKPMAEGVIADYILTEQMIKHFLKKVTKYKFMKPRLAICVPSAITEVEANAAIAAAKSAGAREVFLIEEPVAAAIGAGIDISRPNGVLVLDIGGGTTDVAVISLSSIVTKKSLKVAGNKFDEVIMKYIKDKYSLTIGEKTAESIKIQIGSVSPHYKNNTMEVKGHDFITGLPNKINVSTDDIHEILKELAESIVETIQAVLEITPPELVGDIHTNGVLMTGGGALLNGLGEYITEKLNIKAELANDPVNCVAIGTGKSFKYVGEMNEGFERFR